MRTTPFAALRALPLAARLALAVLLPGILGLVVWLALAANSKTFDDVLATKDANLLRTAEQILDGQGIEHQTARKDDRFQLLVPRGEATKAAETLALRGVKDLTREVKVDACTKPGALSATIATNTEYSECRMKRDIRTSLILGGAHAAHVTVASKDGGGPFGDEVVRKVTAQVFLSDASRPNWDSATMIESVAAAAATDPENVTITDQFFHPLGTAAKTTSDAGSAAPALGCADMADAQEVETKKAAVQGCYRSRLEPELKKLLGATPFALSIEPTIRTTAAAVSTTSTNGRTSGAQPASPDGDVAGNGTRNETTTERTSEHPAGELTALTISIVIDRAGTSRSDLASVRRILRPAAASAPESPAPSVALGDLTVDDAAAAPAPATNQTAGTDANSTKSSSSDDVVPAVRPRSALSWQVLAAIAAPAFLLVAVGALLLIRRLRALDSERTRLESTFQHDQRLFEDFAASNPDAIARELEALFGAPSAAPAPLRAV